MPFNDCKEPFLGPEILWLMEIVNAIRKTLSWSAECCPNQLKVTGKWEQDQRISTCLLCGSSRAAAAAVFGHISELSHATWLLHVWHGLCILCMFWYIGHLLVLACSAYGSSAVTLCHLCDGLVLHNQATFTGATSNGDK